MLTVQQIRDRATQMKELGRSLATRAPGSSLPMPYSGGIQALQNESVHQNQYRYAKKGWSFASIRPIANRLAAQLMKVARKNGRKNIPEQERQALPKWLKEAQFATLEPLARHELLDVVNRPNPYMVQWHLMWITATSLQATGQSYWWFSRKNGRNQVWPVPTHWVSPGRSDGVTTTWYVKPDGMNGEPFEVDGSLMARFYLPDAGNPMQAMSPLSAADRPILSDDAIHESQYNGFQGGHMPDHAFIIGEKEDGDGIKRRPELSPDQRNELTVRLKQLYGGPRRHGRFILLDGLVSDVKRLTMAPTEMDYLASMKLTEREIEKIFGVNPIMMGEVEGANRASATVADDIFLSNVVNPQLAMIGQVLTAFLERCELFSEQNVVVYFDEIVARDPDLEQKDWQFAFDRGMVSIDQYLTHRLGLPPWKAGGDIARINITMVDVPVGKEREDEPKEPLEPLDETKTFKALYGKLFQRQHSREEQRVRSVMEEFFRHQADEFAAKVDAGITMPEVIYGAEPWQQKLLDTLSKTLRQVGFVGAGVEESVVKHFHKDAVRDSMFGLDGRSQLWLDQYMKELLSQPYWNDVGDGIEDDLSRLLKEYTEQGLGTREMADRLRDDFYDLSLVRAQRIARTETTGAMNAGAYAARQELKDTGLFAGQEWNTVISDQTRGMDANDEFNHVIMDGQEVGMNEQFNVDGEMAPFPGHYSLSAGNRCNCNCFATSKSIFE